MLVSIKFKDKEIKNLIKNMCILIDTREQENTHITDYLDRYNIKYRKQALSFGDYSVEIQADSENGLDRNISLENVVAIERKGSGGNGITELAGNFSKGRTTFENEMIRSQKCKYFYLVVENGNFEKIRGQKYRGDFQPKSFYNTIISWRNKYGFHIDFIEKENTASHMIQIFKDCIKKLLQE